VNENTGNSSEFFNDLLDNPADLSHLDTFKLQQLINEFPQSGLLRSVLAVKRDEENMQSAGAYVNPKLLYIVSNAVSTLRAVANDQIAISQKPGEAKPLLKLPLSVEFNNLEIDESNYFHVPIDNDVAYFDDEKAEHTELLEYIAAPLETEEEAQEQTRAEVAPLANSDTEVADQTQTEDVIVSSETGTGENQTDTIAEPTEEKQEDENTASASETDFEVNDTEQENVPAVETEVSEEEAADEDAISPSETDVEASETEEENVPSAETEVSDNAPVEQSTTPSPEHDGDEIPAAQADDAYTSADASTNEEDTAPIEQTANQEVKAEENEISGQPSQADQEIDDEVFEEIVSIEDIGLEQLAIMDKAAIEDETEQTEPADQEEIKENTEADSYFVFEPTLPEDAEQHAPATGTEGQNAPQVIAAQHVSRYNDEKMPYSFMWWLDKTRKEHAAIYQPFATESKPHSEPVTAIQKPQPAADHLQQQYVENIFAVSGVEDGNATAPQEQTAVAETKADKIIEKFIHEEPQIKHPSKVKLDSENKAKKSSEDRDELVTETLAKIYTEQMLYHKAILTYKKLMLKFPEKSIYFAGQIEQLEKKIN